jgi:N-ethylmaleimide reductase
LEATEGNRVADLFKSLLLGGTVPLSNRIVMAPMTRTRTSEGDVPNELMATYYRQRSSAGLIVAEATDVAPSSKGYALTPGIHTEEQKRAWRLGTDEVHRRNGTIFLQLWHVGRMAHPSLMPNGEAPWGVTEERAESEVFAHDEHGKLGFMPAGTPRRLATEEVSGLVASFSRAVADADRAGFDGVEIHAANGYLFDQFMNSVLNTREDRYGGRKAADRTRFLLEVVDEAVRQLGPGRVGVRLSPFGRFNSMPADPLVEETLLYLALQLALRGVAYIHFVYQLMPDEGSMESGEFVDRHLDHALLARVRARFPGAIIWCGGFTSRKSAQVALDTGLADLIAFGRPYVANPDLVERLRHGWPLAEADRSSYYTRRGELGYTDFPAYSAHLAAA